MSTSPRPLHVNPRDMRVCSTCYCWFANSNELTKHLQGSHASIVTSPKLINLAKRFYADNVYAVERAELAAWKRAESAE